METADRRFCCPNALGPGQRLESSPQRGPGGPPSLKGGFAVACATRARRAPLTLAGPPGEGLASDLRGGPALTLAEGVVVRFYVEHQVASGLTLPVAAPFVGIAPHSPQLSIAHRSCEA